MADSGIADGYGHQIWLHRFDGFQEFLIHLSEYRQTEDLVLPELLLDGADAEIVFGSQKTSSDNPCAQASPQ